MQQDVDICPAVISDDRTLAFSKPNKTSRLERDLKIVAPKSIPGLTSLNRKITAAADAAEDVRFAAICLLHDVDATFSAGRREGIDCGNAPS